ncbi:dihydroxy-acid dehydratase ilv3 [Komagataella kurtzmanii]|nr:dihydroxy-acid dehydratase ilv3 [Komagataella kurtzmanii]
MNIATRAQKCSGKRFFSLSLLRNQEVKLNKFSSIITQPKSQGASQAMLYATGFTKEDMNKGQVGVGSCWWSGNPCNMHLLDLNMTCTESVKRAGLKGMQFNTIGVSDGISMGTKGMRFSLQSREIIADSFETIMLAQHYDANIGIPACDKNMPGVLMGFARHNRPSIMVYGGTIHAGKPSHVTDKVPEKIDVVSAFQSYGQFISGQITEEQREDIVAHSCPGPGSCGGMYTANTMASCAEVMGMSLPLSSSSPAISKEKQEECENVGFAIKKLMELQILPKDIMTKTAFENAITYVIATGGSTNAVLHLIAIAHTVGVELTIDDFQRISDKTPFLADFKPSGKYVMADLQKYGGTPAVTKYLLRNGLIDGDCITVTGKTVEENMENFAGLPLEQDIIRPLSNPLKPTGHLQILKGSLAPGGSVAKITGKEGTFFEGKAKCYNEETDFIEALERGEIKKDEKTVVVIRYEGPRGAPGMPEMLKPSSALMGYGLGKDCALLTDGRFSGGSHGFLIGHIVPEAWSDGAKDPAHADYYVEGVAPIALVENGDVITIDSDNNTIDIRVERSELEARAKKFTLPDKRIRRGVLSKYQRLVSDASKGCVLDADYY